MELQAGEPRAEAAVGADPEGQVLGGVVAGDVEAVRVRKHLGVAVCGGIGQVDLVARLDRSVADHSILGRRAPELDHGR